MALQPGNYISVDMSNYIEQWTTTDEQKEIAIAHDCSIELGRKLIRRERKITENNLAFITAIIAKAVENRKDRISIDTKTNKKALNLI
ncbi:MAG: hypothetical protein CMC76_12240 [Flavobacteriaceae bacterium]|nr:hypothetical protein [Flavobacteriaceae bacterium]|tara:strand:+ start:3181 stop:3444 length:264 start_codon:yes stop_codon:yes gene_type:complete